MRQSEFIQIDDDGQNLPHATGGNQPVQPNPSHDHHHSQVAPAGPNQFAHQRQRAALGPHALESQGVAVADELGRLGQADDFVFLLSRHRLSSRSAEVLLPRVERRLGKPGRSCAE